MYDSAGHYYSTYELRHHGILGQKWGVRRFQNKDGTLTSAGRKRYYTKEGTITLAGDRWNVKQRKLSNQITEKAIKEVKKNDEITKLAKEYDAAVKKANEVYNTALDDYLLKHLDDEDSYYSGKDHAVNVMVSSKEFKTKDKLEDELTSKLRKIVDDISDPNSTYQQLPYNLRGKETGEYKTITNKTNDVVISRILRELRNPK